MEEGAEACRNAGCDDFSGLWHTTCTTLEGRAPACRKARILTTIPWRPDLEDETTSALPECRFPGHDGLCRTAAGTRSNGWPGHSQRQVRGLPHARRRQFPQPHQPPAQDPRGLADEHRPHAGDARPADQRRRPPHPGQVPGRQAGPGAERDRRRALRHGAPAEYRRGIRSQLRADVRPLPLRRAGRPAAPSGGGMGEAGQLPPRPLAVPRIPGAVPRPRLVRTGEEGNGPGTGQALPAGRQGLERLAEVHAQGRIPGRAVELRRPHAGQG
ncbi:hypothetical protein D3C76_551780 [compost metagenome]